MPNTLIESWDFDTPYGVNGTLMEGDFAYASGGITNGLAYTQSATTDQSYAVEWNQQILDNYLLSVWKGDGSTFYYEYNSPGYGPGQKIQAWLGNTALEWEFTANQSDFPLNHDIRFEVEQGGFARLYVNGDLKDEQPTDVGYADDGGPWQFSLYEWHILDSLKFHSL